MIKNVESRPIGYLSVVNLTYPEVKNHCICESRLLRYALLKFSAIIDNPLKLMHTEQLATLLDVVRNATTDIDPLDAVLMHVKCQCGLDLLVRLKQHAPAHFYHYAVEGLSHLASAWITSRYDQAALMALAHVLYLAGFVSEST